MTITKDDLRKAQDRLNQLLKENGSRDIIQVDYEYGRCAVRRYNQGECVCSLNAGMTKPQTFMYIHAMIQGYYLTAVKE